MRSIDVATDMGMSRVSYCLKENGKRAFTDDEKIKLTKILNMNLETFLLIFFPELLPLGN